MEYVKKISQINSKNLQKLVCFYAFVGEMTSVRYKSYLGLENMRERDLKKLLLECEEAGLLKKRYFWRNDPEVYAVADNPIRLGALYFLFAERRGWLDDFNLAAKLSSKDKHNPIYALAKALAGGEKLPKDFCWSAADVWTCFVPFATDSRFYNHALAVDNDVFPNFYMTLLQYLTDNDMAAAGDVAVNLLLDKKGYDPSLLQYMQDALALYLYIRDGEYTETDVHANQYSYILHALRFMQTGDFVKADSLFQKAIREHNSMVEADDKGFFFNVLHTYYLVLNYAKINTEKSFQKLELLSRKNGLQDNNVLGFAIRPLIKALLDPRNEFNSFYVEQLTSSKSTTLGQYLGYLYGCYYETGVDNADKYKKNPPSLGLLRHELQNYINITDEEREQLNAKFGAPILSSIHRTQEWELVLNRLARTYNVPMGNEQTKADEPQNTRTIYVFSEAYVDIREQKVLKSGAWSVGKVVAPYSFGISKSESDSAADKELRKMCSLLYNTAKLSIPHVLPFLVDTDQAYTGDQPPFTPVKVMEEKPYMVVEEVKSGFRFTSNILVKKEEKSWDTDDHILIRRSPVHYIVIPISAKQKTLYRELLAISFFPEEARPQLEKLFPKMAADVEIHSSLIEGGSSLEEVKGDTSLSVVVHPDKDCFVVRCYARPLIGGKQLLYPGAGQKLIVDSKPDGTRVQVKRTLSKEKENYKQYVSFLEDELEMDVVETGNYLTPIEMLELIDFVRQTEGALQLEWPEGECLRLKHTKNSDKWNVGLRGNNGWFDVEGDVMLDDDTVMSMGELLDLLNGSQGNYVRLKDGDYLQLSHNLRRQLERIEALATKNHGKMQISQFQAGLLGDDVLNGEMVFKTDDKLRDLREKIQESASQTPAKPRGLNAELRDYQLEGFRWMARLNSWGAGACLADDMGLGKTVQTITYLLSMAKNGPSLVVAPASVVPNWRREIERFAPSLSVEVLNSSADRKHTVENADHHQVVLATYAMLVTEAEILQAKQWNVICLDEAHTIKNRTTKTSESAMLLKSDCKVILTGTPIQNHLGELWNLFRFINPGLLGSYDQFQNKFIVPIEVNHDKVRQQQLNRIVHPFMLRRTKQEVVQELPDKQETIIPVELNEDEMAVYEVIRSRAKEMAEADGSTMSMNTLAEITRLRQAACCASLAEKKWKGGCTKIDTLMDLVNELNASGNKALIFSQFTSFLALAKKALDGAGIAYLSLDGSVSMKQREKLVEEFQQGDTQFFLISLKAGGLGLNLTAANYIIHLDPWWNPAIEQQATDRAYRIGQKQKVSVYRLISQNTIEEKILRLHDTKRNMADALLEGTDMSAKLSAKDMVEMLENRM